MRTHCINHSEPLLCPLKNTGENCEETKILKYSRKFPKATQLVTPLTLSPKPLLFALNHCYDSLSFIWRGIEIIPNTDCLDCSGPQMEKQMYFSSGVKWGRNNRLIWWSVSHRSYSLISYPIQESFLQDPWYSSACLWIPLVIK